MEEKNNKQCSENLTSKVFAFNQFLEVNVENLLLNVLNIARYIFIVMMIDTSRMFLV